MFNVGQKFQHIRTKAIWKIEGREGKLLTMSINGVVNCKKLHENILAEFVKPSSGYILVPIADSASVKDGSTTKLLYCEIEFSESDLLSIKNNLKSKLTLDKVCRLISDGDEVTHEKGDIGYDKTYVDVVLQSNISGSIHTYKLHFIRFDLGDGNLSYNVVKQHIQQVIAKFDNIIKEYGNRPEYGVVKQLDKKSNKL